MSKQKLDLTGYCRLYCPDCIRYRSRAADLARDLLDELRKTEFERYASVKSRSTNELRQYPETIEALETIVGLQCNQPCRVVGGCPTFACDILACCQKKGFEGCWQCADFKNCPVFDFLKAYHGDLLRKNLEKIRELGWDGWVEHRENFFIW